jgi:hypothetical protein
VDESHESRPDEQGARGNTNTGIKIAVGIILALFLLVALNMA